MGKIKKTNKAKLIMGILISGKELLAQTEVILEKSFGKIDNRSELLAFDLTDYYKEEMGSDLFRYWISFEKLIDPYVLCEIKIKTNKIEDKLSSDGRRRVNLDPGYMESAKLILASTKNFSHRTYLDKGIYTEITLIYENKKFCELRWTYPDYKTDTALKFFSEVRRKYLTAAHG